MIRDPFIDGLITGIALLVPIGLLLHWWWQETKRGRANRED